MRQKSHSIFIILVLFVFNKTNAQIFQNITSVGQDVIGRTLDVEQDSMGFIWFATQNGILRYDGHEVHDIEDLIAVEIPHSTKNINSIFKDIDGHLWFGGQSGILLECNPYSGHVKSWDIKQSDQISDMTIFDISVDENDIFLAMEDGIMVINRSTEEARSFQPGTFIARNDLGYINTYYGLHQDKFDENILWLFSRGGLVSYHKKNGTFKYHTEPIKDYQRRGLQAMTSAHQDDDGNLWLVGGWLGLRKYDQSADEWTHFLSKDYFPTNDEANFLVGVFPKSANEFWILSYFDGLGTFNISSGTYNFYHKGNHNPLFLMDSEYKKGKMDEEGALWIGSDAGVSYFNQKAQNVRNFPTPIRKTIRVENFPCVHTFEYLNENQVLAGSIFGDGLYLVNTSSGVTKTIDKYINKDYQLLQSLITKERNINSLYILDIYAAKNGVIWVSTYDGLAIYDTLQQALIFPDYPFVKQLGKGWFTSLKQDNQGYLWLLKNGKTLFKIDLKTNAVIKEFDYKSIVPKPLQKSESISAFEIENDSTIWLLTYFQVFKFNPNNSIVENVQFNQPLHNDFLTSMSLDMECLKNGNLVISSINAGIMIFDPENLIDCEIFSSKNRMPTDVFYDMDVDQDGVLWLTSDKGIVRFDILQEKIKTFGAGDGVIEPNKNRSYSPGIEATSNGKIFYNEDGFVSYIDGNAFNFYRNATSFVSTVEIFDSLIPINHNWPIKLSYTDNYLTFYVGVNSYINTQDHTFSYFLEGYDDAWRTSTENSISYTKVPPGNYKFRVKAGAPNLEDIKVSNPQEIVIVPPFWMTLWFKTIAVLLVLSITYILYRYRMKAVREKERMKSEFNRQLALVQMEALRSQMNPHFLFNSLNSIKNYVLTKDPFETSQYLTKFSHLIRLILQNSKHNLISLKEELEALKLYVEIEALRFENRFTYEISVDENIELEMHKIPPLILQPYVENAIWHGLMHKLDGIGKLTIEIKEYSNSMRCIVEDNGIGRAQSQKINDNKQVVRRKSLGMKLTNERLTLLNKLNNSQTDVQIIDLKDDLGNAKGTRIVIDLPFITRSNDLT